ncbi:MAG: hypothetical protein ACYC27_14700 [Armatimonadota bacterium]
MQAIELLSRNGEHVTHALLPNMLLLPEGIRWGERTFFRNENGEYREGLLFFVFNQNIVAANEFLEAGKDES